MNQTLPLTIGQLAKQSRVNLETIRYYERRGLLRRPPRTDSGYRIFSANDVQRIRFIKRAQELGFSLKEIQELLALRIHPGTSCAEIRQRTEVKIADIDEKIRTLKAMKKALVRLTNACSGRGPVSDCPILESLQEENS